MKMVFVARMIRHKLCMIYAFFDFFVQKSFFTKNYFRTAEMNLTTRGPLYTCLVHLNNTPALQRVKIFDLKDVNGDICFKLDLINYLIKCLCIMCMLEGGVSKAPLLLNAGGQYVRVLCATRRMWVDEKH